MLAVEGIVGGVEVQDDLLRRPGVRVDKLLDEGLDDLDHLFTADVVFESPEGRRRGQGRLVVVSAFGDDLEQLVVPESLMVVKIFVTLGDRENSLGEHGSLTVDVVATVCL